MSGRPPDRGAAVVTGLGVRTPAGNDHATFWATLLAGRSVIATIQRFDPSGLPVRFAGEVRDFDPVQYLGAKRSRQTDRTTQLGFAAALDAVADATATGHTRTGSATPASAAANGGGAANGGTTPPGGATANGGTRPGAGAGIAGPDRCAIVVGTGVGATTSVHAQSRTFLERGGNRLSAHTVPMVMPNATAALIAIELGWTGPNLCIATACASALNAIGEGVRLIREGSADVVLAGGTECAVTPVGICAFAQMGALSTRHDDPARASRPFDRDRDGFVMAEGAAFVVLERAERAAARGAEPYGEVRGYGRNSDAFHLAAPSIGGVGASACMRLALRDAGVEPAAVSHISAHGTATPLNDRTEAVSITEVFGRDSPPVTSTKGVTGHLIGAAGAVQVVASLLGLRHGVIPPTANCEQPDPEITLDVVTGSPRPVGAGPILINSFGFGGHNACLVLGPVTRIPDARGPRPTVRVGASVTVPASVTGPATGTAPRTGG